MRVRIRSTPAEDLQYRRQEVTVGSKTLVTPVKSVDPTKLSPDAAVSESAVCVNEMYRGLTGEAMSRCILGDDRRPVYDLNRARRLFKRRGARIEMCFLEMKTKSIPTQKEIEFATDLAYVYSDITPLPMLSGFADRVTDVVMEGQRAVRMPSCAKLEVAKEYLRRAVDTIMQLNSKPIMGYVPNYRLCFGELVGLYVDRGINAFYFDARGSTPIALQASLRAFLRELSRLDALEDSLVHMINPGTGRAPEGSAAAPARDVLGFGLGIDSLGDRHVQIHANPNAASANRRPGGRYRLFDKSRYSYLLAPDAGAVRSFYPGDSGMSADEFLPRGQAADRGLQNAFNSEQLALEASRLGERLAGSEPMLPYLAGKPGVKEDDVKILRRARVR